MNAPALLFLSGRRVAVTRLRFRRSAARNMARAGWRVGAICAALGAKREAVEAALAIESIWGDLAKQFRRAA